MDPQLVEGRAKYDRQTKPEAHDASAEQWLDQNGTCSQHNYAQDRVVPVSGIIIDRNFNSCGTQEI